MEQELLTLLEHLSSPPVFSGVRVTRSLVLCVSDYPFGIFKLFQLIYTIYVCCRKIYNLFVRVLETGRKVSLWPPILLPFLSVALHESGTRNSLLGPLLNNTEVYLTHFIRIQNHTIAE